MFAIRSTPRRLRRIADWNPANVEHATELTKGAKGKIIIGTPKYDSTVIGLNGSPAASGHGPEIAYYRNQIRGPPPGTPAWLTSLRDRYVPPRAKFDDTNPGDALAILKTAAQWSSVMQSRKQSRSAYALLASVPTEEQVGTVLSFRFHSESRDAAAAEKRIFIVAGAKLDVFGRAGAIYVIERRNNTLAAFPVELNPRMALHGEGWEVLPRDYLWLDANTAKLRALKESHEAHAAEWADVALRVFRGLAVAPQHTEMWKLLPAYHAAQAGRIAQLIARRTEVATGGFTGVRESAVEPWKEELAALLGDDDANGEEATA